MQTYQRRHNGERLVRHTILCHIAPNSNNDDENDTDKNDNDTTAVGNNLAKRGGGKSVRRQLRRPKPRRC